MSPIPTAVPEAVNGPSWHGPLTLSRLVGTAESGLVGIKEGVSCRRAGRASPRP